MGRSLCLVPGVDILKVFSGLIHLFLPDRENFSVQVFLLKWVVTYLLGEIPHL